MESAHCNTGISHFENKWRADKTIKQLRFPSYVINRPVFFMENLLNPWFKPGIDRYNFAIGIRLDTYLQMVEVGDISKYRLLEWFNSVGYNADINGKAKEFSIPPLCFMKWARQQDWQLSNHSLENLPAPGSLLNK